MGVKDTAVASCYGQLAQAYRHGIGITKDLSQAEMCFKRGVMLGGPVVQNNFGSFLAKELGRVEEGIKYYEMAASCEYPRAMVNLAWHLNDGLKKSEPVLYDSVHDPHAEENARHIR